MRNRFRVTFPIRTFRNYCFIRGACDGNFERTYTTCRYVSDPVCYYNETRQALTTIMNPFCSNRISENIKSCKTSACDTPSGKSLQIFCFKKYNNKEIIIIFCSIEIYREAGCVSRKEIMPTNECEEIFVGRVANKLEVRKLN